VYVEAQGDGAEVIVSVRDTGMGIPANESGRIWDRSYRGDASRAQRGLGLGLSVVKAVVQAHRGTIEVSTQVGSGSCFTVHLPAVSS
jgi:signal transduction histidine kinase